MNELFSLSGILGSLGLLIGICSIWLSRNQVREDIRDFWPNTDILILGPKAVGKTSLICYLTGKKFPIFHMETTIQTTGKILFSLRDGNKLRFRRAIDIGGDEAWKRLRRNKYLEKDPDGVIFVANGEKSRREICSFKELQEYHIDLIASKKGKKANLRGVLVLINKSDVWSSNTSMEKMISKYEDALNETIQFFRSQDIKVQISACSVRNSSDDDDDELIEILRKFSNKITP